MLRKVRIVLGPLVLSISIFLSAWGYWPLRRELRLRPLSGAEESAPAGQRAITLLFPPKIRVGEAGVVRLTLGVDALQDLFPAAAGSGSSSIFDTHTVVAEARFDIPGIYVQPSELISAPVSQGQTAVFYWTLRPGDPGEFRGTIWLYARAVDGLTGEERRETVSAQIVEIESVKFLGLVVNRVRLIGLAGVAIGFALSLPFIEALAAHLHRKRREIL